MSGDNPFSAMFSEKSENMGEMAELRSPVSFDLPEFMEYVRSPKHYSFIVLFTAMGSFPNRCEKCAEMRDEFQIVTDSYKNSPEYKKKKLFFGAVDFETESAIFNELGYEKAPIVMHFPPSGVPKPSDAMDLEKLGVEAEAIGKWVERRTSIKIKISRPKFRVLLRNITSHIVKLRKNLRNTFWNAKIAGVTATLFCYEMSSGVVWNSMREPPYFVIGKNGPIYIKQENRTQDQYLTESYIYILLNCNIAFGMSLVITAASERGKRKNVRAVVGTLFVLICFFMLLSIFRYKIPGYPFGFLL